MKIINKKYIVLMMLSLVLGACSEDFLDKKPTEFVGQSDATATADNLYTLLNGIHRSLYIRYEQQSETGIAGVMQAVDIAGEDIVYPVTNGWFLGFYNWQSNTNQNGQDVRFPYRTFYQINRNANTIINSVDEATGSLATKKIVKGQALVYRAFCHFQLVQLYGKRYVNGTTNSQLGVPIVLTVSTELTNRSTVEQVYAQINKDLDEAMVLLTGYTKPNNSHLDLRVAQGLKARVALVQGNWAIAADFANKARAGKTLMTIAEYGSGFNNYANQEWMWGSFVNDLQTESFANFGAYMSRNFSSTVIRSCPKAINRKLYSLIPTTDVRSTIFSPTGNHPNITLVSTAAKFPFTSQKFLSVSTGDSRCDVPYMRAAEMFLIEAEAKANLGAADAAKVLFDLVSKRDPAYVLSTKTGAALLSDIYIQRRIELWGEGFRFFDLKRTNSPLDRTGAQHNTTITGGVMTVPADDKRWQYLIPISEINLNPSLEQNPI
jgi:hypothetical protein